MTVNLNSAAFLDQTQNDFSQKIIAETYMQLYQYAAEDFPSHPDLQRFINDLRVWMVSVDQRLAQQMALISSHTHVIPPHIHGVINHSTTTPTPLSTLVANNSKAITWSPVKYPIFMNSTMTIPNYGGNYILTSSASEGSILPKIRRALPIPITLLPKLSPVLTDALLSTATGGLL